MPRQVIYSVKDWLIDAVYKSELVSFIEAFSERLSYAQDEDSPGWVGDYGWYS